MTAINHHAPDDLLAAYAVGTLPQPFALVIAAHISLCLECRAAFEAHQAVGGAVLESVPAAEPSGQLRSRVLGMLDEPLAADPTYRRSGIFPAPVMASLKGRPPQWKPIGMGVRQSILGAGPEGSARLLYIPPGQSVPDHSHGGLELTLVLQGSFRDETGTFAVGDLEVANEDLSHTPAASPGAPCICLAATDSPLHFNALIPRMLQRFIGI